MTAKPSSSIPKLSARSIHKSFGNVKVLEGISLDAHEHDVISIVGASGSGKSTFLRCLNFLENPTSGRVLFDGEEVLLKQTRNNDYTPADSEQITRLRMKFAMVFQSFNLWSHMTVMENVVEAPIHVKGLPRATVIEKAEHLLNRVGLFDRKDYFPAHMSGGQQQRAAIARALAMDPEVILFDEPTSSLDPELVGEVLKVMRELADEGRTMIVVTHEMEFARDVSSRVIFFCEGKVEEDGLPKQILVHPSSTKLKQFLSRTRS